MLRIIIIRSFIYYVLTFVIYKLSPYLSYSTIVISCSFIYYVPTKATVFGNPLNGYLYSVVKFIS